MNIYKQKQIQEARLKIKRNLRKAGISFVLFLVYAFLGWQVMMAFYGSPGVMFMSIIFVITFIPVVIYFVFGCVFLCVTWQFIENAANAKMELNSLLWVPPV